MPAFINNIFKEECIYSIKSRILRDNLGAYSSYLGKFLSRISSVDFPNHLQEFYEETKHLIPWNIETIISDHTIYDAIKPFLNIEKQSLLYDLMVNSTSRNIQINIGLSASTLDRSPLPKYCPLCCKSDMSTLGEAFFHRIHQIPNIQVCPDHNCNLSQYKPSTNQLIGFKYFYLTDKEVQSCDAVLNQCEVKRGISVRFKELLHRNTKTSYKEKNYRSLAESKGYLKNDKLLRTELVDQFKKYYKNVKDEYLHSRIDESYYWLGDIALRPHKIFNPIQYLLFDQFIENIDRRFEVTRSHPFGNGPWVCLNKAAEHYMTFAINDLKLETNKTKLIGVFNCSCGMEYSKVFVKTKGGLKERIRIRQWGEVWMNKMNFLVKGKYKKSEMAKSLGTEISTLDKIINRKPKQKYITYKLIKSKRAEWLKKQSHFTTKRYLNCRLKYPELYKWLIRYDPDWLKATKGNASGRQLRLGFNWNEIDNELCQEVQKAAISLKLENPVPRISKTLIGKSVKNGSLILSTNLQKLPKTIECLEEMTESIHDYQVRRVKGAVNDLKKSGKSLTKSSIIKNAKIKTASNSILREINSYL